MGAEDNDVAVKSTWNRILVIVALLSGASSNIGWLSSDTGDRYKAADADRDFHYRDERHASLKREFVEHRATCNARHRELEKEIQHIKLRWAKDRRGNQ